MYFSRLNKVTSTYITEKLLGYLGLVDSYLTLFCVLKTCNIPGQFPRLHRRLHVTRYPLDKAVVGYVYTGISKPTIGKWELAVPTALAALLWPISRLLEMQDAVFQS
jgi:hypothetical protein